uniref:Dynactin subunit 2 n=1 Tax=Cacopsylla melanoneura TaxID=428564 RepID=A0A8D8VKV0_9HEMI
MADPKYANLSGIAYDQPDVYETDDLPEADQGNQLLEEKGDTSEHIERLHIDAKQATLKFKDKTINVNRADFSDSLNKLHKYGYDVLSQDWELVAKGEKETPIQKYQRLQCELKELVDEVSLIKEPMDRIDGEKNKLTVEQIEQLVSQVSAIKLDKFLGQDLLESLSDVEGAALKTLVMRLDSFAVSNVKASPNSKDKDKGIIGGGGGDLVRYQLGLQSQQAHLNTAAKLTSLEHRLIKLENMLGEHSSSVCKLFGGGHNSLIENTDWLRAQINLIDATHCDAYDARITHLSNKLDKVIEKATSVDAKDGERDQRVNELYELSRSVDSALVPRTLERLIALESLHAQASNFATLLKELESVQVDLAANLTNNQSLLTSLETKMSSDVDNIKHDVTTLNEKIKSLKK